jgi:signal transduction histidine kinase
VREAVTNVVRHSAAHHCRIVVDRDGVEIVDDGRGPAGGGTIRRRGLPAARGVVTR